LVDSGKDVEAEAADTTAVGTVRRRSRSSDTTPSVLGEVNGGVAPLPDAVVDGAEGTMRPGMGLNNRSEDSMMLAVTEAINQCTQYHSYKNEGPAAEKAVHLTPQYLVRHWSPPLPPAP
jgi:hypothetical protein